MEFTKNDVINSIKIYNNMTKEEIDHLFKVENIMNISDNIKNTLNKLKTQSNYYEIIESFSNKYEKLKESNEITSMNPNKEDIKNVIKIFEEYGDDSQMINNLIEFPYKVKDEKIQNTLLKLQLLKDPEKFLETCLDSYIKEQMGGYYQNTLDETQSKIISNYNNKFNELQSQYSDKMKALYIENMNKQYKLHTNMQNLKKTHDDNVKKIQDEVTKQNKIQNLILKYDKQSHDLNLQQRKLQQEQQKIINNLHKEYQDRVYKLYQETQQKQMQDYIKSNANNIGSSQQLPPQLLQQMSSQLQPQLPEQMSSQQQMSPEQLTPQTSPNGPQVQKYMSQQTPNLMVQQPTQIPISYTDLNILPM